MMNEWIISSTLLIAAVLAVRFVLRGKISLRLRYALWLVVLVRLLVPVQLFTSDYGVGQVARDVDLSTPVRRVYTAVRSEDYQADYETAYRQIQAEYEARDQVAAPESIDKEASSRVEQSRSLDVSRILYSLWLGGMVVLSLVLIGCNGRFALRLRRSRRNVEENVLLPVYESALVPTPCMFGVFSPAIYLTPEVAGDEKARAHVLAHELIHYRHLDHIWSVLRCVCLVLHWYNPLVWVAFRLSREDAELACDEGALEKLGEEARAEYGRTLIQLTCGEKISTGLIAATTMTGSARSIARRLKTLLKKRRTTLLALIAVIVAGVIAVGCGFAGAPEPSESGESPTEPEETNPVEEQPLTVDGVIVYPGTSWNMTPEEVKEALKLKDEDCEVYVDVVKAANYAVHGFAAYHQTFLGFPVTLNFEFRALTRELELGLCVVKVIFETERDLATVQGTLRERLGAPVSSTSGVMSAEWESAAVLADFFDGEFWTQWKIYGDGSNAASRLYLRGPGVSEGYELGFTSNLVLQQLAEQGHTPDDDMSYHGQELPIPDFTEPGDTDVVAYFNTLLNPALYRSEADWYPRALTSFYDDPTQMDLFQLFYNGIPGGDNTLSEAEKRYLKALPGYFPELDTVRIPAQEMDRVLKQYFGITLEETAGIGLANFLYIEGQDCYYHSHSDSNLSFWVVTMVEEMGDDVWRVKYERNPDYGGAKSPGAITLRLVEDQWQVLSNVSMEGELTQAQIDQVNAAFEPYLPMPEDPNGMVGNPISCFFTSYYVDARELDLVEFLRYCPLAEPATEEEFRMLTKLEDFPCTGTMADMPVPLHRYRAEDVDALLKQYTGYGLDELSRADLFERDLSWNGLYYLPETDCYYNTTSDAGFGMFRCIGGQMFIGSVELYANNAVLILREENGKYYIESHMALSDESTPEEDIADTVEAFLQAYQENVYLNTENEYDHLTVLAADPDRTVTYQGESVALSEFYGNIEYLHDKETYWKHVRQDQGITRSSFQVTTRVEDIRFDGNAAIVQVGGGVTFTYTDAAAPSGMGEEFEILLVYLDDTWLVADVTAYNDWFDAENKNNPDFDVDALIAE